MSIGQSTFADCFVDRWVHELVEIIYSFADYAGIAEIVSGCIIGRRRIVEHVGIVRYINNVLA